MKSKKRKLPGEGLSEAQQRALLFLVPAPSLRRRRTHRLLRATFIALEKKGLVRMSRCWMLTDEGRIAVDTFGHSWPQAPDLCALCNKHLRSSSCTAEDPPRIARDVRRWPKGGGLLGATAKLIAFSKDD